MKYFCYFQRNHVGMIRDFADADLLSSDYAAGGDENRCNVLQDGLEKITGKRNEPPSLPHHATYDRTTFGLVYDHIFAGAAGESRV